MKATSPRVLVIGGGIAGQCAAWLLQGPCAVTLCEAAEELGGNHLEVEREGEPLNLGASYVVGADVYSLSLLEHFDVQRSYLGPRDAQLVLDRPGRPNLAIPMLLLMAALLAALSVAAWVAPGLKQLPLLRVLGWLPAGVRRAALLGVGYDPVSLDDLDGLLFFPYMRYVVWCFFGTGYLTRWAQLSRVRLPAALRALGATLHTSTPVTALKRVESGGFEATVQGPDGQPRALQADLIICACYPQAAGRILSEVVPPALSQALQGARATPGYALVVPTPPAFAQKRLTMLASRGAHGRTVNAMLDQQFGKRLTRAFYVPNTQREDLLDALGSPGGAVAEHDHFVHSAPDHQSIHGDLRPLLAQHTADPAQDIFFCSYAYDPSGFRNADQSIMTAVRAARKICARRGLRTDNLDRLLAIRPSLVTRIKRSLLDNKL